MTTRPKKPHHVEFGRRLEIAADGNPSVPPPNYGRLGWFSKQLLDRFGTEVKIETVRKWFAGETMPRQERLVQLAQILGVDVAWLTLGLDPEVPAKEQRVRNAAADGIVNVLAGYVEMSGGRPAFPDEADERARRAHIDLYAVIKGAHYPLTVVLGEKETEGWRFAVPVEAVGEAVVIGAKRTSEFCVEFIELDHNGIAQHGKRRGSAYHLHVPADNEGGPWRKIRSFSERI